MATFQPVQAQPFFLAGSGCGLADTSIILRSFKQIDGVTNLTMTDFGSVGFMTLEPRTSKEEDITFTGVTQNADGSATLTGVTRGLLFVSPYSGGTGKSHGGGTQAVVSNSAPFYKNLKDYIDTSVSSGASLATNLVTGISKLSVAPGTAGVPIAIGDNDPRIPTLTQAQALVGTGTPSSTNKFVTQSSLVGFATTKFGGTGADGVLNVTSGTTTIDLGGLSVFVRNYTSISITGTGQLVFINPATSGTTIVFKSQGNVTITSTANPAIDLRLLGGAGGVHGTGSGDNEGGGGASVINNGGTGFQSSGITSGAATSSYSIAGLLIGAGNGTTAGISPLKQIPSVYSKQNFIGPGAGGAGSYQNSNSFNGGRGAGAMYIECGGTYTASSIINASGQNTDGASTRAPGAGGGGSLFVLYNILGSNTATYNVLGGVASNGVNNPGGGTGYALVALNTEFA